MLEVLSKSQLYRDYELAFTEGTGLPLCLHGPGMRQAIRHARGQENPFCALLAKTNQWHVQCDALHCKLEEAAQFEAKTLQYFGGLCATAVPVCVGGRVIAFLHTGQNLLQRPGKAQFGKITAALIAWGAEVDLQRLEAAYYKTRVLPPKQYASLIRVLDTFARQLASTSNLLALAGRSSESAAITRARGHIRDHSSDELSLETVAQVASMSAGYFSEQFKESTGLCFVQYVGRARVEQACHLLLDPHPRISEIAFQVGFQSLSQFNRAFLKVEGQSPRDYRTKLRLANA